jgi:SAM-dependent methyltransferase
VFEYLKRALNDDPTPGSADKPSVEARARPRADDDPKQRARRRTSSGLRHFLDQLPRAEGLQILDLGGLTDSNAHFLSEMGSRIHAVDLLHSFDAQRSQTLHGRFDDFAARQFVDEYLPFRAGTFDAILVWDVLHFLDVELLNHIISRLAGIVRPEGAILCFFHNQPKGEEVPVCRYAIESANVLRVTTRRQRLVPTTFSNRHLETLFRDFNSVQFFLSRDSLREVIAVR